MRRGGGYLIGFDIGGTRLKSGVVRADGRVERPTLEDTSRGGVRGPGAAGACASTRARTSRPAATAVVGIGIALPGIVETAFGSRYLPGKVLGIEGYPLRETLEVEFGLPVRCVNDGAAATLAEWRFGAARGIDDVVGITLGTGVGSGVVVGRQAVRDVEPRQRRRRWATSRSRPAGACACAAIAAAPRRSSPRTPSPRGCAMR